VHRINSVQDKNLKSSKNKRMQSAKKQSAMDSQETPIISKSRSSVGPTQPSIGLKDIIPSADTPSGQVASHLAKQEKLRKITSELQNELQSELQSELRSELSPRVHS